MTLSCQAIKIPSLKMKTSYRIERAESSRLDSAMRYYWLYKNPRRHLWKYFYPELTGRSSLKTIWIRSMKNQFH